MEGRNHRATINRLLGENQGSERLRFRKRLAQVFGREWDERGFFEEAQDVVHFRPDLFLLDADDMTARIWEVEFSHPLTTSKLRHLAWVWQWLDYHSVDLQLTVVDGRFDTEKDVDLQDLYFKLAVEDAKRKNLEAA